MERRAWLSKMAAVPLAGLGRPAGASANGRPPSGGGFRSDYFPNVVLQTHQGKKVRFYDDLVKGKIVVFNMMYAQCEGLCPPMTANLVKVQQQLGCRVGRDIFMYSITLQPEVDTPPALKRYAKMHGVKPGWLFLTGRPADVDQLRRKLGFFDIDPAVDQDKTEHIGLVRFGNEALDRWAATPALSDPGRIVQSILWMDHPKKGFKKR